MLYLIKHIYDGNLFSYLNPILKSIRLRLDHPNNEIGLMTNDKKNIDSNDDLNYLLSSIFDSIYDNNDRIKKKYTLIESLGNNDIDYDNHNLVGGSNKYFLDIKKDYGDVITKLFLFKEFELIYTQNLFGDLMGGNFERKLKKKMTDKEKLDRIVKLYDLPIDKIKLNQIKYFYTTKNNIFRPFNISSMISKIKPYQYMEPLKIMKEYFPTNSYHEKIYEKYHKLENIDFENKMISQIKNSDLKKSDMEFIFDTYLKSRDNIHVIILWKPFLMNNNDGVKSLIKYLKEKGNVYHFTKLNLYRKDLEKLVFTTYDDFTFSRRNQFVKKKLNYIMTDEKDNDVGFIFFDNVKNLNILGHHSTFKNEIKNKSMELLDNDTSKDELRGSDLIHITNYFYHAIDINNFIRNQRLKLNYDFGENFLKFQTLKKILFYNLSLLEIERILITNIDDKIKGVVLDIDDGNRINKFIQKNLINPNTKYYYFDFEYTKDSELITNPKNYYYVEGIKFLIKIDN